MLREEIPEVLELVPLWSGWGHVWKGLPSSSKIRFFCSSPSPSVKEKGLVWRIVNFLHLLYL